LNGSKGAVRGWNQLTKRYTIELLEGKGTISVKPTNVELPLGTAVRLAEAVGEIAVGSRAVVTANGKEDRVEVAGPCGKRLRLRWSQLLV
jgi:hypothetical protein